MRKSTDPDVKRRIDIHVLDGRVYHVSSTLQEGAAPLEVNVVSPAAGAAPLQSPPKQPQRPAQRRPVAADQADKDPVPEEAAVEEEEPPKTFLQKYWMYLLPIALFVVFGGGGGGGQ